MCDWRMRSVSSLLWVECCSKRDAAMGGQMGLADSIALITIFTTNVPDNMIG